MAELQTFESVARLRSISKAADELNCSQPCVSQRIKALEERWALRLFVRTTREVEWAECTHALYPVIHQSLNEIDRILSEVVEDKERTLTVSVSEDFAAFWMVQNIETFNQQHRSTKINCFSTNRFVDFGREQVDAAIRLLPGDVRLGSELQGAQLACGDYVIVASPQYLAQFGGFVSANNVRHAMLLTDGSNGGWDQVFAKLNVVPTPSMKYVFYPTQVQAVDAAREGKGLVIARKLFVSRFLAEGSLRMALSIEIQSSDRYYFVHPRNAKQRAKLATLHSWLNKSIAESCG